MKVNLNASESEARAAHSPFVPNPPAEASCAAFHYYLELVCRPLRGVAPDAWVEDLRAELSSHLECLAEAHEELGEGREAAVAQACRSLGDPAQLGEQWAEHWKTKHSEPFPALVKRAFTYFALASLVSIGFFLASMKPTMNTQPLADLLRIWGVLILPVHAGLLFGRHSHGRRGPAAATAIVLLAGVTLLVGAVWPGSDPVGFRPFVAGISLIYTLPLGTAAAAIAGRLKDRKRRRARLAG